MISKLPHVSTEHAADRSPIALDGRLQANPPKGRFHCSNGALFWGFWCISRRAGWLRPGHVMRAGWERGTPSRDETASSEMRNKILEAISHPHPGLHRAELPVLDQACR